MTKRTTEGAKGDETLAVENRELKTHNAMLSADLNTAHDIQNSLEEKIALLEHTQDDQSR